MGGAGENGACFSCTCGKLTGRIAKAGVRSGTHVVCFCHDCRAAQLYFGQPDPAPGPVDVFHLAPEDIQFETGAEELAAMQLGPKGMIRWYAKCCNAPLAVTPQTRKFPFAGFIVKRLSRPEQLGPVTTRGFVPRANGNQAHEKLVYAAVGLVKRVGKSRLTGRWRNSPFFDATTGAPIAAPKILTKAERSTYYPPSPT